jgi:23S rRNA (guanosine2251-2'-O)-methyltransferase
MVGKRKRLAGSKLAGNHQRCWISGRNAVLETLRAGVWRPLEILRADRLEPRLVREVESLAADIPIEIVDFEELTARCRSTEHQGLSAKMPEFPYAPLSEDTIPPAAQTPTPFLVILDGIQDPHNFGAMIRSAEVFGAAALIIGERGQSGVTPHVARSSAGAVNHVPIVRVTDIGQAIGWIRDRGYRVLGMAGEGEADLPESRLDAAIAIVIGNEGVGLSEEVRAACDRLIRIPQPGRTESLNAAVAAGIVCYEIARQRAAVKN